MLAEADFLNLLENSEMLQITYAAGRPPGYPVSFPPSRSRARAGRSPAASETSAGSEQVAVGMIPSADHLHRSPWRTRVVTLEQAARIR